MKTVSTHDTIDLDKPYHQPTLRDIEGVINKNNGKVKFSSGTPEPEKLRDENELTHGAGVATSNQTMFKSLDLKNDSNEDQGMLFNMKQYKRGCFLLKQASNGYPKLT